MIEMTGTVVPKAVDNGKRLQVTGSECEERFSKCESRVDDKVEGYYGNSRFLVQPLKVML